MLADQNIDRLDIIITSVKRRSLLEATIRGILNNVTDLHLVDRWIISDDGSTDHDLEILVTEFPFLEIHRNPVKGHANNLNYGHGLSEKRYILHFEDDWVLRTKVSLSHCTGLLKDCNHVAVVAFPTADTSATRPTISYPELSAYVICNVGVGWPGFGLQPGVWDMWRMHDVGMFKDTRGFEKEFSERFRRTGYLIYKLQPMSKFENGSWVDTKGVLVQHIGWNNTAYSKNKTHR